MSPTLNLTWSITSTSLHGTGDFWQKKNTSKTVIVKKNRGNWTCISLLKDVPILWRNADLLPCKNVARFSACSSVRLISFSKVKKLTIQVVLKVDLTDVSVVKVRLLLKTQHAAHHQEENEMTSMHCWVSQILNSGPKRPTRAVWFALNLPDFVSWYVYQVWKPIWTQTLVYLKKWVLVH